MIDQNLIKLLTGRLQASDVTQFECHWPQGSLRLDFSRGHEDDPQLSAPVDSNKHLVKATCMGRLCFEHPLVPLKPICPGDHIEKGQLLAFLGFDQVFVPLYAKHKGGVTRLMMKQNDLVGYADPILEMEID
ncbi:MAG: acetyl-CoA carboxylase biotin carboxyl carrier protein subunit [Desulfotignum sp.]|nr:acetyl-CoA carboxylase biotin carboxyl carrier protein subunit [Desulfotignum sp.]